MKEKERKKKYDASVKLGTVHTGDSSLCDVQVTNNFRTVYSSAFGKLFDLIGRTRDTRTTYTPGMYLHAYTRSLSTIINTIINTILILR